MRLLLLLPLVIGCTDPFGPVGLAERISPPVVYRVWHAEVEACAGRASDFDAITWWLADSLATPAGRAETAATWTPPHTIHVRRDYAAVEWIVKHELIHDLLQDGGHQNPILLRCELEVIP